MVHNIQCSNNVITNINQNGIFGLYRETSTGEPEIYKYFIVALI